MNKTLLVFGHGYSASALSKLLQPLGWQVIGTSREVDASADTGVTMVPWPGTDMGPYIAKASHVLISIAPSAGGDPVLQEYGDAFSHLDWLGYLSTTAVYGDHQGGWVDEDTPLDPSTQRGKWRVAAEQAWAAIDAPLHIFRLAGIYGPGCGPLAKVRSGTARRIIKQGQVFSRIHVEDIAQTLMASINQPNPGTIYNVCDDEAAPPQDVIGMAADMLGMTLPDEEDFEVAEMTPMARSFYAESKRVKNDRLKRDLGVNLIYPTYREGLRVLLDQENEA